MDLEEIFRSFQLNLNTKIKAKVNITAERHFNFLQFFPQSSFVRTSVTFWNPRDKKNNSKVNKKKLKKIINFETENYILFGTNSQAEHQSFNFNLVISLHLYFADVYSKTCNRNKGLRCSKQQLIKNTRRMIFPVVSS